MLFDTLDKIGKLGLQSEPFRCSFHLDQDARVRFPSLDCFPILLLEELVLVLFLFVFLLGGGAISEIAERISSVFVSAPGTWSGAARWEPSAGSRPIAPTPRHWRRRPATPGRRRRRVSVAPRPALEFRPSGRVQSDTLDV